MDASYPLTLSPALLACPCEAAGCSPGEGVNHLRDSFALNMMKPSRGPGTFSPSLLMLVRQSPPLPRRRRHQDKCLMPERKAAMGLMPLWLLLQQQSVCAHVCVCVCIHLFMDVYCIYKAVCSSRLSCQLCSIVFQIQHVPPR